MKASNAMMYPILGCDSSVWAQTATFLWHESDTSDDVYDLSREVNQSATRIANQLTKTLKMNK